MTGECAFVPVDTDRSGPAIFLLIAPLARRPEESPRQPAQSECSVSLRRAAANGFTPKLRQES